MRKEKAFLLLISFLLLSWSIKAIAGEPNQKLLYKIINGDSLYLHVFKPQNQVEPSVAIVFFFGEDWTSGTPKQFYQQSEYLSARGILAICAEYRMEKWLSSQEASLSGKDYE